MINTHPGFAILKCVSKKSPTAEAVVPLAFAKICPRIAGKVTSDTAKMIGIIPAWLTLIGKYDFSSLPVLV